jgi:hypothetical protein
MSAVEAMEGLTFGCDPEMFIVNSDGEFVAPDGIIPGTKEEPYKVKAGAVQQDGMAAEFNIDPVTTYKDWEKNITTVMAELEKFLPDGHKLVAVPSATFSEKEWEKASDHSKILGCSPDFNAWTGTPNAPPEDLENPRLRCAGGHIHYGWTEDADMSNIQHISACRDLVKQMDWYLGAWSLRMDKDPLRRRLYGKAGAMRFKPYGVEYRTLSNFWIANPNRRRAAWDRMQTGIWKMRQQFLPTTAKNWNPLLIEAINTSTRDQLLEKAFHFPIMDF